MKAYPEYKASGIDWLGKIPSHWELSKGKWCCLFTYGFPADSRLFSKEKIGLPLIRIRDINNEDTEVYYIGSDYPQESLISKGDILIGMDGDFNVAKWNGSKAILNQRVCKYEDSSLIKKNYIFYLLPLVLSDIHTTKYATTVKHLSAGDLLDMVLPIPSLSEQEAIARYLDEVTAKIDALMAEKQKQVEDLYTYRTSLITETVTHGLNPNVSLRPSGIDWLGDIPQHWNLIPLKYLLQEPLMYGANESPEDDIIKGHPRYIRITDISETGNLKAETYRTLSFDKAKIYLLEKGDILFARSGATAGKTYLFNEEYSCCFAGYLIKATCSNRLESKYLMYYTNSQPYNNWKNSIFDKSTIQNISADKYNQLQIPIPSQSEQREIVKFLDSKTAKIDTLIKELEAQLGDLATYRQAVITEAVTGKVDVRDRKPKN